MGYMIICMLTVRDAELTVEDNNDVSLEVARGMAHAGASRQLI